jgi:hypothetical protein
MSELDCARLIQQQVASHHISTAISEELIGGYGSCWPICSLSPQSVHLLVQCQIYGVVDMSLLLVHRSSSSE